MPVLTGNTTVHKMAIYGRAYGSFAEKNNSSIFIFDLRIMDRAVSESGGVGVGSDNGSISYFYDVVLNNDGQVNLPFG